LIVAVPDNFEAFYLTHWRRLVAALAWTMPAGEDPEDVAQEAFARAFSRWSHVGSHARPDAWLFVTAYRLALRGRQRGALRRGREQGVGPRQSDPEEPTSSVFLQQALGTLQPRQRAALLLRHYYGLSTKETARLLRCREGTVKSLLSRARDALRSDIRLEVEP
jgi:RNA polymerase sigma-70 factor (ECF subfamily)